MSESAATSTQRTIAAPVDGAVWNAYATRQWYAVYTRANHEKCAAVQLQQRAIEHFLPLYETVRHWKDRSKRMELPLFPGYIFVRMPLEERLRVLVIPGVVRLVGFDNRPAALPDDEVEALRTVLSHRLCAEPHPYLTIGRRVRIARGALQGMEGVLIRKKGRVRLVLSVDLIHRSAVVDLDCGDVDPI